MIDPELFIAFLVAVTILMLIPGPNVALIVANSIASGPSRGLLTVAGTSSAMVLQLLVFAIGLTGILEMAGAGFELLRWLGVAYLLYLGIRQWRAPVVDLTQVKPELKPARTVYLRAFLVSLTNPKTLLFYGAFFPQFIDRVHDVASQIAILSSAFIIVAVLVDGGWAMLAGKARGLLVRHGRLRNRISGALLAIAGIGLALARTK